MFVVGCHIALCEMICSCDRAYTIATIYWADLNRAGQGYDHAVTPPSVQRIGRGTKPGDRTLEVV